MTQAIVGRWGNNPAVRFPHEIARELRLHEGDRLEIEAQPDQIVIHHAKPRYTVGGDVRGQIPSRMAGDLCRRLRLRT